MGDRIDSLFQEWHRAGGAVLLAQLDPGVEPRSTEDLIAESTAHCRASGRLTWVVLDWMIRRIEDIDAAELLVKTAARGDLSVLGVLCDAAYERTRHPKFQQIMRRCAPHPELVPFFHRVARSPLATRLAREHGLALFKRWNYFCAELTYLGDRLARGAQASAGPGTPTGEKTALSR